MLNDQEKQYLRVLIANKLKPIQKRSIETQQQIDCNFTLDRIQRITLYEKRLKTSLSESLVAQVQALIETHRKLNKTVDKSDYDDLVKTMKTWVDSSIKHFSEEHLNNPFGSRTEDSIIEAKIYILTNTLPWLISDSL